jgi:hypothetical protein
MPRFLDRKMQEYEGLKVEIKALQNENSTQLQLIDPPN